MLIAGSAFLLALAVLLICKRFEYVEARDLVPSTFGPISFFFMIALQIALATDANWVLSLPIERKSFLKWTFLRITSGLIVWALFLGAIYLCSRFIFYIPPEIPPAPKAEPFSYPVWLFNAYLGSLTLVSAMTFWPKRTFKISPAFALIMPIICLFIGIALINEWITFFWAAVVAGFVICVGYGRSICENFALKKSSWRGPTAIVCSIHMFTCLLALAGYWQNSKSRDVEAKIEAYSEIGLVLPKLHSDLLPEIIADWHYSAFSDNFKTFVAFADEPLESAASHADIRRIFDKFEHRYGETISEHCISESEVDKWRLWKNEKFLPELLAHLHRCKSNNVAFPYLGMVFTSLDQSSLKKLRESDDQIERSYFLQYAKINPEIISPDETLTWAKNSNLSLDNRKRALELYYIQTGKTIPLDNVVRSPASISAAKYVKPSCSTLAQDKNFLMYKIKKESQEAETLALSKCLVSELRSFSFGDSLFLYGRQVRHPGNFPIVDYWRVSGVDYDSKLRQICKTNPSSLFCIRK